MVKIRIHARIKLGLQVQAGFHTRNLERPAYDFIMRDIRANHVALVEEGRAGADVLVYDSKTGRPRMGDENKKAAELALVQALLALHQEEAENDIEGRG